MRNPKSSERRARQRGGHAAAALITLGLAAGGVAACGPDHDASDARRAAVAEHGAPIMGFDLERTTHRFRATDTGGVQTVVVDDPADTGQLAMVRAHLTEEAERFAGGDFSDPAAIHGHDMPGLESLSGAGARLSVTYAEVPLGARITYRSDDPAVVDAVHEWFAAQQRDHGDHARSMP